MQISQRAFDFIVEKEVSDEKSYNQLYLHTEWPGGESGVTVGIGFDLGMSSTTDVRAAWAGVLPAAMVSAMCSACGVIGGSAKMLAEELKPRIEIPFKTAMLVFERYDIPREEKKTRAALPNCDKLSANSFGALVSLVYNRGASFHHQRDANDSRDRYREMRNIKTFMGLGQYDRIPGEFISMKRLWAGQGLDGLLERRDEEAQMFADGLGERPIGPASAAPQPQPTPTPTPTPTPQPAPSSGGWLQALLTFLFGGKK